MWNKIFERLRLRMTFTYAVIFGVLILAIVFTAYCFVWWEILANEKQELIKKVYHEAEEWVNSGENPCSDTAIKEGSMLAYFVTMDGEKVILNQLGDGNCGKAIWEHRGSWPQKMNSTRILRMHGVDGEPQNARYRYLAAVAPVMDKGKTIGKLYMFENIEFYYAAAFRTLFKLLCVAALLFAMACYFGYWLAGRNILPISSMYARQMQFTADASHEMRTPLAVMGLAAQGLAEDGDSSYSEFAQESIGMIQSETARMSKLTENLMALARSDEGILPQLKTEVNMTKLCRQVGAQLSLLAQEKGIALQQHFAENLTLLGDEAALNRLLVILLDNALKYSPANTTVDFIADKSKGQLLLVVKDEGCGISDEDKNKVFDRFYRVDKARSRSQGGLGLGLSLAQAIIKQHHGTIKILDNKPCGTIMQVLLPM